MKPESVFVLENADWPAILVDESATVRKASHGAKAVFGGSMEGTPTLSGSIWAKENDVTAEQFFSSWSRKPVTQQALKFRVKDGSITAFSAFINRIDSEKGPHFVVQLFKLETNTTTETLATAQKQKLDCALQLSRTVALDFNNALTSILGHTSLLLSKLET